MCRLLMCSLLRCARWGLFLPLLLLLAPVTSWASEMPQEAYTITEAELRQLEGNLTRLQQINDSLRQTCGQQQNRLVDLATALNRAKQQLATAQRQQTALQLQIQTLQDRSTMQAESLEKANKSLAEYATEAKKTRLRIKAQRNTWATAAGILAAGLALK